MNICDLKMGMGVAHTYEYWEKMKDGGFEYDYPIGFVTGLTRNSVGETIVLVSWDNGETKSIHPSNLQPLTLSLEFLIERHCDQRLVPIV